MSLFPSITKLTVFSYLGCDFPLLPRPCLLSIFSSLEKSATTFPKINENSETQQNMQCSQKFVDSQTQQDMQRSQKINENSET